MDDQWQDPEHAGDGGADEYSWSDRDGLAGNYTGEDDNEDTSDVHDKLPNPKNQDELTLIDLKVMLTDLSDRLKKFEKTSAK